MKKLFLISLLTFSFLFTYAQRKEIKWARAIAPGTANKFAGWDASGNAVEKDAGGITNTAIANELMKSDGTNAVPSGLFSTSSGNMTFTGTTASIQINSTSSFILETKTSTNADVSFDIQSANGVSGSPNAKYITIFGGAGYAPTNGNGGSVYLSGGNGGGTGEKGNIYLNTIIETTAGGGQGVILISNATTVPTTNPVGGSILYAEAGALKARGTSGTITTLAPADPHCPICGSDFVVEYENEKYGYFAMCMKCLSDTLTDRKKKRKSKNLFITHQKGAWHTHK